MYNLEKTRSLVRESKLSTWRKFVTYDWLKGNLHGNWKVRRTSKNIMPRQIALEIGSLWGIYKVWYFILSCLNIMQATISFLGLRPNPLQYKNVVMIWSLGKMQIAFAIYCNDLVGSLEWIIFQVQLICYFWLLAKSIFKSESKLDSCKHSILKVRGLFCALFPRPLSHTLELVSLVVAP